MQEPQILTAEEIVWIGNTTHKEYRKGEWLPARPEPYGHGLLTVIHRAILAWHVFTGRYDAVDWEDT